MHFFFHVIENVRISYNSVCFTVWHVTDKVSEVISTMPQREVPPRQTTQLFCY